MVYYQKQNQFADQQMAIYTKMTALDGIMITTFQQWNKVCF